METSWRREESEKRAEFECIANKKHLLELIALTKQKTKILYLNFKFQFHPMSAQGEIISTLFSFNFFFLLVFLFSLSVFEMSRK